MAYWVVVIFLVTGEVLGFVPEEPVTKEVCESKAQHMKNEIPEIQAIKCIPRV